MEVAYVEQTAPEFAASGTRSRPITLTSISSLRSESRNARENEHRAHRDRFRGLSLLVPDGRNGDHGSANWAERGAHRRYCGSCECPSLVTKQKSAPGSGGRLRVAEGVA